MDKYDRSAVTVRALLGNVQQKRDGVRKDLAAAREEVEKAGRNEDDLWAREVKEVEASDNV